MTVDQESKLEELTIDQHNQLYRSDGTRVTAIHVGPPVVVKYSDYREMSEENGYQGIIDINQAHLQEKRDMIDSNFEGTPNAYVFRAEPHTIGDMVPTHPWSKVLPLQFYEIATDTP